MKLIISTQGHIPTFICTIKRLWYISTIVVQLTDSEETCDTYVPYDDL